MSAQAIQTSSPHGYANPEDIYSTKLSYRAYEVAKRVTKLSTYLKPISVGVCFGLMNVYLSGFERVVFEKLDLVIPEKNSEYELRFKELSALTIGCGVLVEELIFRRGLQYFLNRCKVDKKIGLVASSILFGATHLLNPHKNCGIQAILSTFSGLKYGMLYNRFGFLASYAAHLTKDLLLQFFLKSIK
jgi:membrane protease YdiL (CAAX protease family)